MTTAAVRTNTVRTSTVRTHTAGVLLREWRERRRLSQLDLANLAGTSSRHLSYVETGRSRPSREMVLRLGEALDVPLGRPERDPARRRARACLLGRPPGHRRDAVPAGSARPGAGGARPLAGAGARRALRRRGDQPRRSTGSWRWSTPSCWTRPVNVVRAMLHPRGLCRYVVNDTAWRAHLLRQVRRHAAAAPSGRPGRAAGRGHGVPVPALGHAAALRARPSRCRWSSRWPASGCGSTARSRPSAPRWTSPRASWRIETFLPADDATRTWLAAADG
jgi:transcriptional regulator with XRE-family HTH domain